MLTTNPTDTFDPASSEDGRRQRLSELRELWGQFPWEGDLDALRWREEAEAP